MVSMHMKGCSTFLAIRKIQMKSTMRSQFTLSKMAIILKNIEKKKCWQGYRENKTAKHH